MDKIRVNDETGCWEWQAALKFGYGRFQAGGVVYPAHRWAFEYWKCAIPPEWQIDHLCRNRGCVFPGHLQAVTAEENVRRSMNPAGINSRKTHCTQGHEFTSENTYLAQGRRICRTCQRAGVRRERAERRNAA